MTPIQQMFLGAGGGGAGPVYIEDVFSNYAYKGNATAGKTITNGIDLSEGGIVWTKNRGGFDHRIFDTAMGVGNYLRTNENDDKEVDADSLTAFNSNGFTLGTSSAANMNTSNYVSWSFKKQKGFLDIVTYEGTGSNQNVNHSLGAVPGSVWIKRLNASEDWSVWHKATGDNYNLRLNDSGGGYAQNKLSVPNSSYITIIGDDAMTNGDGDDYIAYIFAGGESPAATARSVKFGATGSGAALTIPDHADWDLGTTWTIEAWVKPSDVSGYESVVTQSALTGTSINWYLAIIDTGAMSFYDGTEINSAANVVPVDQWTHVALVNNSGTAQWYINGIASGSSASLDVSSNNANPLKIGRNSGYHQSAGRSDQDFNGLISNLRIVKGTAVYTSTFTPPTEPLTNITNTKLLCCNNSSVTGSTVTPDTISTQDTPTASTDSPFNDPAGFIFGENEDQPVIKCDGYTGNGTTTQYINVGFEPQWLMIKRKGATENWYIFNALAPSWPWGQNSKFLEANTSDSENWYGLQLYPHSNGFYLHQDNDGWNANNSEYIYIAISRPDIKVGKIPEAGTDVFAMDTGGSSTDMDPPNFDAPFAVDMAIYKEIDTYSNWFSGSRLLGTKRMKPDQTAAWTAESDVTWDSNAGWSSLNADSDWMSWMWKRAPGFFDVVAGNHSGYAKGIRHRLGVVPEMVWIKNDTNSSWSVYHKDLNGGTNPEQYRLKLDLSDGQQDTANIFDDRAPTATEFFLGAGHANTDCVVYLFASVADVSKLGSFAGSSSSVTVTTGFSSRFILIKQYNSSHDWYMFDTVRGITSGNDDWLKLNDPGAHNAGGDHLDLTSDGFIVDANANFNGAGNSYIYYAIA